MPKNWRNRGSLSKPRGNPPVPPPGTNTVRSVSIVTTAGPARRTAAATNDWRARPAEAAPWAWAATHPQGDTAAEITRPAANIPEGSMGQVRNSAAITIATNLSEP